MYVRMFMWAVKLNGEGLSCVAKSDLITQICHFFQLQGSCSWTVQGQKMQQTGLVSATPVSAVYRGKYLNKQQNIKMKDADDHYKIVCHK